VNIEGVMEGLTEVGIPGADSTISLGEGFQNEDENGLRRLANMLPDRTQLLSDLFRGIQTILFFQCDWRQCDLGGILTSTEGQDWGLIVGVRECA
jgi:hypothetical protein